MATSPGSTAPKLYKILTPIAVLLILIFTGLNVIKLTLNNNSSGTSAQKLQSRSTLPDFTLTHLDETPVKVSDLKVRFFLSISGQPGVMPVWKKWILEKNKRKLQRQRI